MTEKRKVVKRDGRLVDFDEEKIMNAVDAAFTSIGVNIPVRVKRGLLRDITVNIPNPVGVENIQNRIERWLMDNKYFQAARAFILYRERHKEDRFLEERLKYMEDYSNSKVNAASSSETDANSNVSQKNAANLEGEVFKTTNRRLQRRRMKRKLKEMFPEVADQYEKDLDDHIIYVHDEASTPVLKPYCMAASLYPLMAEGTGNIDGVTPTPPNDIQSFSGQVTNLVFLLSSQVKGAVALGEYLIALNYYVVKEFGPEWYKFLDEPYTTRLQIKQRTVRDVILKGMKQFIYGVNQPAGNRSYNSPFSNISYYDHTYFDALFKDFYYPDGTQPEWHQIDILQRMFCKLHRELRLIKPLTFPVTTFCMVHDGKDCIDKEFKEWAADEYAKGTSAFTFLSDTPTSLASCCFSGDTKILWKSSTRGVQLTTFKELHELPWEDAKKNLKIFHNGSWVAGKSIKLPGRQMYKVTTENGKQYIMTDNHINVTLRGEKPTECLTTDDYLMFNTLPLSAVPEKDRHLTYSQGFIIGAFLGDGSFGSEINGVTYQTIISQNRHKVERCKGEFETALRQMGIDSPINVRVKGEKHSLEISSKDLVQFITEWTHWYRGTYSNNKRLNLDCLLQSEDFRRGILDGWYNTDGGNSNRCYTTSQELAEDMEVLITSLGMQSVIDISDRTDEPVVIRGEEYTRNYPLYCVRWYSKGNHRTNKDGAKSWIKKNNSIYFKIKSIDKLPLTDEPVYCIECRNEEEPYFTLPSGLITHNCRVLNELTFSSTTGGLGVMTGSCNVITLNLNRIVQNWARDYGESMDGMDYADLHTFNAPESGFRPYLINILERVYKYQIAFKTLLYEQEDKGMFSASNAGYIYLSKLYCTIGVIGYFEAAKFLGIDTHYNPEYVKFLQTIFGTIKEENEKHSIHDAKRPFIFNTEAVPGESLGIKFYNWDSQDGYVVPEDQNLYNCYFYSPWDETDILSKMKLHGKEVAPYLGGGLEMLGLPA